MIDWLKIVVEWLADWLSDRGLDMKGCMNEWWKKYGQEKWSWVLWNGQTGTRLSSPDYNYLVTYFFTMHALGIPAHCYIIYVHCTYPLPLLRVARWNDGLTFLYSVRIIIIIIIIFILSCFIGQDSVVIGRWQRAVGKLDGTDTHTHREREREREVCGKRESGLFSIYC